MIADVNAEAGQGLAGELGGQARFVQADVTDDGERRRFEMSNARTLSQAIVLIQRALSRIWSRTPGK